MQLYEGVELQAIVDGTEVSTVAAAVKWLKKDGKLFL
jgi:hypothetical protein